MLAARSALRRRTSWRSLALLLAVAGIVLGILGMHTLTGVPDGATAHAIHGQTHHPAAAPETGHDGDALAGCPAGACDPGHAMTGMLCLLALLLVALLLVGPAVTASARVLLALAGARANEPPGAPEPEPPSLTLLSISRT